MNDITKSSDKDSTHENVHPDHRGRDAHGTIADPDLSENEARSGRTSYGRFVLSKSMLLILILMPLVVAAVYFVAL